MPMSMHLEMTSPVRWASTRPPKLLQPRPTAETMSPELPRLRYSTFRGAFLRSCQLSVFSHQPGRLQLTESCGIGDDGACAIRRWRLYSAPVALRASVGNINSPGD